MFLSRNKKNNVYPSKPVVSLTLCCFVVYSTRRFVYVILFLSFFSPFSIAITSLGEVRANLLSAFRTFVRFVLVWFCRFPLRLGV